ncbi:MAG: phosphoglycerate kinase [Candidatus Eremiobacteraeota bacterium]|nr:phosphoglycerate kinase [Candidatus Eremiobacteraeota bacterium]MBV8597074.1 phosphoglycerate kinase [Candidatus Eremiobacteraeota bacterium]
MTAAGLESLDVSGKRVLVREDLNVPLEGGRISDATRIQAAVPTLRDLRARGAKVIVMSHLGRPDGKVVEGLRLAPIAAPLGAALGCKVTCASDCIGPEATAAVAAMENGDVLLLENLRFHPGEEANDPDFARALASLGDLYVNDAFGTAHRAHASTVGITKFLPSYMGPLLRREVEILDRVLRDPQRPFVAVLGGAKVSDKIGVIERLMDLCDAIVVGGGMANTLLAGEGFEVGKSLRDKDLGPAKAIMRHAESAHANLHLPKDAVVATSIYATDEESREVPVSGVGAQDMILDIGPDTAVDFRFVILKAKTVLWNGPMGVFENEAFSAGTESVGKAIVDSGALSLVGGGDSAAAAHKFGLADRMTHISTGGGATLEYIEGRELPGIAALRTQASA